MCNWKYRGKAEDESYPLKKLHCCIYFFDRSWMDFSHLGLLPQNIKEKTIQYLISFISWTRQWRDGVLCSMFGQGHWFYLRDTMYRMRQFMIHNSSNNLFFSDFLFEKKFCHFQWHLIKCNCINSNCISQGIQYFAIFLITATTSIFILLSILL